MQALGLVRALSRFRYVGYREAEEACAELADMLVGRFGRRELGDFAFAAIPRGGFVALGMLLSILGVRPPHGGEHRGRGKPVVVVDDCALSGYRFGRWLRRSRRSQVIFAPLFSHPKLRSRIEAREVRVSSCLSPRDLREFTGEAGAGEYRRIRRIVEKQNPPRYWVGTVEALCFPWGEPDRAVWNDTAGVIERGWRLVPGDFCLKNRAAPGEVPIPVQIQPAGEGRLRPAPETVFGGVGGTTVLGNLETGKSVGLRGSGKEMWRAVVSGGSRRKALKLLEGRYRGAGVRLRRDFEELLEELLAQGFLIEEDLADADHQ